LFRLSAEQGNASAQNNLGLMYAKGQGVPQDYFDPHVFTLNGEVVSPKCIVLLTENMAGDGAREEIKLPDPNGCNDRYHYSGKGNVSVEDNGVVYNEGRQRVTYKHYFGGGIHIVNIFESGGGSGVFNTAVVLKAILKKENSNHFLIFKKVDSLVRGDRCNSSINDVLVLEDKIVIKRNMTSRSFIKYINEYAQEEKGLYEIKENYFDESPPYCVGFSWLELKLNADEGEVYEELVHLEIDKLHTHGLDSDSISCMRSFLKDRKQLRKEEIPSYLKSVNEKCLNVSFFLKNLLLGDGSARFKSAEEILKKGDISTTPVLLEVFVNENDSSVKSLIAEALGKFGSKSAVPSLVKALDDSDEDVRISAIVSLGKLGDQSAVPKLFKLLNDKNEDIRYYAIHSLGNLQSTSSVPALILVLRDKEAFFRAAAAEALGKIGDKSAIGELEKALNDQEISDTVQEALIKLGETKK
jgi:hypothetical protein